MTLEEAKEGLDKAGTHDGLVWPGSRKNITVSVLSFFCESGRRFLKVTVKVLNCKSLI